MIQLNIDYKIICCVSDLQVLARNTSMSTFEMIFSSDYVANLHCNSPRYDIDNYCKILY